VTRWKTPPNGCWTASDADRLAGATAYLKLAGDVTGGWLLCVGAVAAQRKLKEADGEESYAQARIAIANIFAQTALKGAAGLLGEIKLGYDPVFGPGEAVLASA
jgi:hypothetical protein